MSDVSKLKINNITYNIKDSLALRDAPSDGEEYVRKNGAWEISSGGESDSIVFGDDSVIIQPGEGVGFYGDAINFENGSAIITTSERTIKNLWDIVADSFTTTVSYSTDDYVIHEENLYQFITNHPAGEWNDEDVVVTTIEDGLNLDSKVSKSGDTMTGNLYMNAPKKYIHQCFDYSVNDTPSNNVYVNALELHDTNDINIGYIQHIVATWFNNATGISISAARPVNGTNIYHGLSLMIDPNGKKCISLDQASWLNALGLTDSGWKTATLQNSTTGSIYYRKIGKVVNVICYDIKMGQAVSSSYLTIATIPDGYRPKVNCFTVGMQHSGGRAYMWKINITASGDIIVYSSGDTIASGAQFSFNATYMIP